MIDKKKLIIVLLNLQKNGEKREHSQGQALDCVITSITTTASIPITSTSSSITNSNKTSTVKSDKSNKKSESLSSIQNDSESKSSFNSKTGTKQMKPMQEHSNITTIVSENIDILNNQVEDEGEGKVLETDNGCNNEEKIVMAYCKTDVKPIDHKNNRQESDNSNKNGPLLKQPNDDDQTINNKNNAKKFKHNNDENDDAKMDDFDDDYDGDVILIEPVPSGSFRSSVQFTSKKSDGQKITDITAQACVKQQHT